MILDNRNDAEGKEDFLWKGRSHELTESVLRKEGNDKADVPCNS